MLDIVTHRRAHDAFGVLAAVVVAQHEARRHAVRRLAVLVLARGDVLPQDLHLRAQPRARALVRRRAALARVAQQQQALLLLLDSFLAFGGVRTGTSGRHRVGPSPGPAAATKK